jgi:hypothetical protein
MQIRYIQREVWEDLLLKSSNRQIRNTWKFLKCFAGERWKRSVGRMEHWIYEMCMYNVRNGVMLHRIKEERSMLHAVKRRKANWIGHIWRGNCLLKHDIEGKKEGRREIKERQGRRRKQLLDDLKEKKEHCRLKDEALDRTLWRNGFFKRPRSCRKTDC